MLSHGIITRSNSKWAAPMIIVKKKDGTLRICVDYRRLNDKTCGDVYPMPRTSDLIDQLGAAKYIATLDLTKGYWQVPVAEKDQCKTAFITPFGLFEFIRMPFGVQGAPATFQRMMDKLLEESHSFANAYIDDLIIFSEEWSEYIHHLQIILGRIKKAGLTMKKKKRHFGASHCSYFGHVVGGGEVRMEHMKVEAVQNFPIPV